MTFSVLVVEDDPASVAAVTTCLIERYRASVDFAYDLKSGLGMATQRHFNIVLLDLVLPDIKSPSLLLGGVPTTWQAWREVLPNQPTVIITRMDLDSTCANTIRDSGDRVISKSLLSSADPRVIHQIASDIATVAKLDASAASTAPIDLLEKAGVVSTVEGGVLRRALSRIDNNFRLIDDLLAVNG